MIFLATPIWRYLDVRTAHSIAAAVAMNAPNEVVWWETMDGDALISRTRSQLATKFVLEESLREADVMVIIDDDIQFQPEDVWKIVQGARNTGDLYGGVYVTRSRKPHPASLGYPGSRIEFRQQVEPSPVEIRYLATGFMAVPRHVLVKMLEVPFQTLHGTEPIVYCEQGVGDHPMYDFFRCFEIREEDGKIHYLSEDWAFCERARQAGFKVWADQSIILGHRAVVTVTPWDLVDEGHALSERGAPSKGSSILVTQPEGIRGGSVTEEFATTHS